MDDPVKNYDHFLGFSPPPFQKGDQIFCDFQRGGSSTNFEKVGPGKKGGLGLLRGWEPGGFASKNIVLNINIRKF